MLCCERSLDEASEWLVGKRVFYKTRYAVLRKRLGRLRGGEEASLYRLKCASRGLVGEVVEAGVLAHTSDTVVVVDSRVDEHNPLEVILRALLAKQEEGRSAVVVSGRGENITFVVFGDEKPPPTIRVALVDAIPPKPSRLEALLQQVEIPPYARSLLDFAYFFVDSLALASEASGRTYSLCPLEEGGCELRQPPTAEISGGSVVGCALTAGVLRELGLSDFELLDMCPLRRAADLSKDASIHGFVARCCRAEDGVKLIRGYGKPVAIVPWSASPWDLVTAISEVVKAVLGLGE